MKKITRTTKKYVESCALAIAFTLLPTACADDIANNKSAGSDAMRITFNIQDATRTADEALAKSMASRATHLQMQGLKPSDITVRTFDALCSDGSAVTIMEETTPGLPAETEEAQIVSRGTHVSVTNGSLSNQFKATAFFGAKPGSLSMDSKFKDQAFNGNGSPVDGSLIWKGSQPCGHFFAYGPYIPYLEDNFPDTKLPSLQQDEDGNKKIEFSVSKNVMYQSDLVTATSDVVTLSQENKNEDKCPPIKLKFMHPLTALRFKIGQDVLGNGKNEPIRSVTISGVKAQGTYVLPEESGKFGTWENVGGDNATFTLLNMDGFNAVNNVCVVGTEGRTDANTMFMIPQKGKITISVLVGTKTIHKILPIDWRPGTTKTYSFYRKTGKNDYHLTVDGGEVLSYDINQRPKTATVPITITSYKTGGAPLAWSVDGYEVSNDDGHTWTKMSRSEAEKIINLSKESGNGSPATNGEKVTATVHWDVVDKLAERNKKLQKGQTHGSPLSPFNLATGNCGYDVEKGKGTTANCYIVSAPGTYAIPLVYGNAIKKGAYNAIAYNSGPTCYKNYEGKPISNPYIIGGAKAKIIWQDGDIVSDNLEIKDNNLVFTVAPDKIRNGNAVVAVTDDKGVVMWSWHLWFTIRDEALKTTTLERGTDKVNVVASEPLGLAYVKWLQSENSDGTKRTGDRHIRIKFKQNVAQGQNATVVIIQEPFHCKEINTTSYQFGRKDPMPSIQVAGFDIRPAGTDGERIQDLIQNPGTFYYGQHLYSEFNNGEPYWLWATYKDLHNINDEKNTVKTIYDPCPAGFKVMPKAYIPIFTNEKGNSYTKGNWDAGRWMRQGQKNVYLLFAPASRDGLTGNVEDAGKRGYYWAARVNRAGNLSGMVFSKDSPQPTSEATATVIGNKFPFNSGCGILPVQE